MHTRFFFRLELELLDRIAGHVVSEIARSTIENRVEAICGSLFDLQHLDTMNKVSRLLICPHRQVYQLSPSVASNVIVQMAGRSLRILATIKEIPFDTGTSIDFFGITDTDINP